MVLYLRLWLFLFIIIIGEILLTEIKITIKNTAEHRKEFDNTSFVLRRKQFNHKILRVLNEKSFRQGFYHTFLHLLLRIISYTLNALSGYEFRLRFSGRKGFM